MFGPLTVGTLLALVVLILVATSALKILTDHERGIVLRLGLVRPIGYGPGPVLLIPLIDRMARVSLRPVEQKVPPQGIVTRDDVSISISAVTDARKARSSIGDCLF